MAKEIKNLGASVRARLLKLSKANRQSFDLVLTRFALERLLFRLSQSPHADRFVLKGAMLMMTWFDEPHRGTRDLDLLGFGDPSEDAMLTTFRDILTQDIEDGFVFAPDTLRADRIREEIEYGGLRLRAIASVGGARVNLTIDIGFGDALDPGAEIIDYPVMLDLPAPRLRAYARETVIAEKFQAMVALGRANSRVKDFYDIWILSRSCSFDGDRLAQAIAATFARRETPIPTQPPDALTPAFATDTQKQQQWRAFVEDIAGDTRPFVQVLDDLAVFLMPHANRANELSIPVVPAPAPADPPAPVEPPTAAVPTAHPFAWIASALEEVRHAGDDDSTLGRLSRRIDAAFIADTAVPQSTAKSSARQQTKGPTPNG